LLVYGATVFRVDGTYDDAYRLCAAACEKFGWYNRNCAYNPYLVEGKKTGGLEIAEQCMMDPPEWVVMSVGDGCSIAGVAKGLRQMRELELIDWAPKLLGVQAAGVAPITDAFASDGLGTARGDTFADSINCPQPRNWRKAVVAVRESEGAFVNVTDDEIRAAMRDTGRLAGVFAEPAAAAAYAGYLKALETEQIGEQDPVLVLSTGSGLKDSSAVRRVVPEAPVIEPTVGAVKRLLKL